MTNKSNLLKKLAISALTFLAISSLGMAKVGDKVVPAQTTDNIEGKVIAEGLNMPWAMTLGPDDNLWITERQGKTIDRIDTKTGEKTVLYTFENAFVGPQHEGVLGLALEPNFLKNGSKNYVYSAYTYKENDNEYARIVRLTFDKKADKLKDEKIILDKLPASNDHNSGRLIFGPDNKLYYTIGDQGNNQGNNINKPIVAQRTATSAEVKNKDFSSYPGSTLRLNIDGSIPSDNPVINGVRSHIYTYGHRNAQGLVFANGNLYSNEHGPSSDDEINRLVAGGNYGWPNVAGFRDNAGYEYVNNSDGGKKYKETDFNEPNYIDPLKTFFTVPQGYNFDTNYINWPTIAPSSLAYYPANGKIAAFRNSLLVSSLKNGALYSVKLTEDGKYAQGDVAKYFKTDNRYRMVVVSPDTTKIYIATDNGGNVMGVDGKITKNFTNPGSIIMFEYKGE